MKLLNQAFEKNLPGVINDTPPSLRRIQSITDYIQVI